MAESDSRRNSRTSASRAGALEPRPRTPAFRSTAPVSATTRDRSYRPRSCGSSQDQRRVTDRVAAMSAHERNLRARYLTLDRILVTQLPHAFNDLQHALHVGFGELATGRVC